LHKIPTKAKKFKIPVLLLTSLFLLCLVIQNAALLTTKNSQSTYPSQADFQAQATYDNPIPLVLSNQVLPDNIFIMKHANVTLINSTVIGNAYLFNDGVLQLLDGSNVTGNIVCSDSGSLLIDNSTVGDTIGDTIECRDSSSLIFQESTSLLTSIYKFNSANVTVTNSSLYQISDFFGTAGQIHIINSQINIVSLTGISISQTYIDNSTIQNIVDSNLPFTYITGPISYELILMNYSFSTSQRQINLTWLGWDSPVIDGYLNLTFEILLDGQFYTSINGSGYADQFSGHLKVNFTSAGKHNVSIVAFDGNGNNSTATISLEIIEYPEFPWTIFLISVAIILGVIAMAIIYTRSRDKHGYHSSLGVIFKKELLESKIKVILFIAIGVVPGLILYLIFMPLKMAVPIDTIRGLVSIIFTLILYYLGLAFSIVFAAGAVVNERKSGALSWFLSKPVRRWEFLWGKVFAYLLIIVLMMLVMAVSFVVGCFSVVDPLYRSDLLSMGGFIFLLGLLSIVPLTAIVVLCSSVFKKPGLAIMIPIMILIAIPPIVSFLPIVTKNEIPLLFSFTYYSENLGSYWIYNAGGLFGSIGSSYGMLLGIDITPINLTPMHSILILTIITAVCLALSTYTLQKRDIA
jgi:ABC-type transport system involved in multi-copper enzyme maturation permease subunit